MRKFKLAILGTIAAVLGLPLISNANEPKDVQIEFTYSDDSYELVTLYGGNDVICSAPAEETKQADGSHKLICSSVLFDYGWEYFSLTVTTAGRESSHSPVYPWFYKQPPPPDIEVPGMKTIKVNEGDTLIIIKE